MPLIKIIYTALLKQINKLHTVQFLMKMMIKVTRNDTSNMMTSVRRNSKTEVTNLTLIH